MADEAIVERARRHGIVTEYEDGRGDRRAPPTRIPRATYRVQLNRAFTFADAARLAPYLARLGVSHLYCSPILRSRAGSTHGYDIIDHGAIDPELGGSAGFEDLVATLRAHGLGLVLDVVPNHMGIMGADNAWWLDVLEHGPAAAHAELLRHRLAFARRSHGGSRARAGARRPLRRGPRAR